MTSSKIEGISTETHKAVASVLNEAAFYAGRTLDYNTYESPLSPLDIASLAINCLFASGEVVLRKDVEELLTRAKSALRVAAPHTNTTG